MRHANPSSLEIYDEGRLDALNRTHLLDSPTEEKFDRLTRLAARFTNAPIAAMTLIDDKRQFIKSQSGYSGPLVDIRETPLNYSLCKYVVERREPLIIHDATTDPLVRNNPSVTEMGVKSYLGVPLQTPDEFVLGALCAVDIKPRRWTQDDLATLKEIADIAMTSIFVHDVQHVHDHAESALSRIRDWVSTVTGTARPGIWVWDVARGSIDLDYITRHIFEVKSQQVPFESFLEVVCKEDRRMVEVALRHAGVPHSPLSIDLSCFITGKRSGKKKWLEIKGRQLTDHHGLRVSGTVRDNDLDLSETKKQNIF
ncbi:MAG: GAF domain-containing protein [Pseudomonadota bacterium]